MDKYKKILAERFGLFLFIMFIYLGSVCTMHMIETNVFLNKPLAVCVCVSVRCVVRNAVECR